MVITGRTREMTAATAKNDAYINVERFEDSVVERELRKVIRNLRQWKNEIGKHHEEISVRNYAIGLEIMGFTQQFPPRLYRGLDLIGTLAEGVGLSSAYLNMVTKIVSWLYSKKNVHNIRNYMRKNNIANWSHLMQHYFIENGKKNEPEIVLSRRYLGVKSSLNNLKMALPKARRHVIDEVMVQIDNVCKV